MRGLLGRLKVTRSFANSVEIDVALSRAADHNEVAAFDNQVNPEVVFPLSSFGKDESSDLVLTVDVCSSESWPVCV